MRLELQDGSQIFGNVVANATANTDRLRLGGTGFSILGGSIGAAGQYRNFDIFEKTGSGTWALTGNNTATTNWTIQQGTLQLGNGGTTGSIIGNVTNNGTLSFNRSNTYTYAGVISGTGAVNQIGDGTTVLTGTNTYIGGTTISRGVLSVSADGNLGSAAGGLTFNGGILQVTGTGFTGTPRAITWGAAGGGFDIADAANNFTVSQSLAGGGPLGKIGAGSLILTADNSYTWRHDDLRRHPHAGQWRNQRRHRGGRDQQRHARLQPQQPVTFGGVISGSGAVNKMGPGTTVLPATTAMAAAPRLPPARCSSAMAAPPARSWVTWPTTARSPSTAATS